MMCADDLTCRRLSIIDGELTACSASEIADANDVMVRSCREARGRGRRADRCARRRRLTRLLAAHPTVPPRSPAAMARACRPRTSSREPTTRAAGSRRLQISSLANAFIAVPRGEFQITDTRSEAVSDISSQSSGGLGWSTICADRWSKTAKARNGVTSYRGSHPFP